MVNKQCVMMMILMCTARAHASVEVQSIGRTDADTQTTAPASSPYMGDYDDLVMCLDDTPDEFERLDYAPQHWTRWIACKEALKAFYALVMTKVRRLYYMCTSI